jgi:serine/threonine protein kinase
VSLRKLGRYELIRVLGKGAMGVVYEGRDPNLDRRVAIKTVKVENLSEEAAAEYEYRFRTEARSAARLQHPNIVSVYDSDRDGNIAFLVMEYIQGDDLKHYLDRGVRYSLEQSLKMIRDLLSALDYAHKQGIVHRDIKPANLLIEPGGRVKLTDFGVARIQDSGEATRTQGSMVGTLKYMSPEQVQGQKIDSRADLFSVGVVLYQLLTDKRPFDGDNDFSIIHQIIGHSPPPPSSTNAKLPAAIDAVVARALAKNRDDRFATARDFAVALQSAIRRAEDQTVVPPADPTRKRDAGSTNSRAGGLTTPTSPSVATVGSVTQELELVYWKDVKDSTDPEELQGFLDKFPAGIYADLARRRLRRLASGATGDQTTIPGAGTDPDLEATRVRTEPLRPVEAAPGMASGTTPLAAAAADTGSGRQSVAKDTTSPTESTAPSTITATDFTRTVVEEREAEEEAAAAGEGAAAVAASPLGVPPDAGVAAIPVVAGAGALAEAAASEVAAVVEAPTPAPVRPERSPSVTPAAGSAAPAALPKARESAGKPPWMAIAAIGVVAAIGTAAVLTMMKGSGDRQLEGALSGASAAASAAMAAGSGAEPAPVSAPTDASVVPVTAPVAAASAPVVAVAPPSASGPPGAASAAAAASGAKRPVPPRQGRVPPPLPDIRSPVIETPVAAPAPRVDEPRPRPSAATAANAPSPVEQCRDRIFLSKELCLAEHCDKPGARNHPLCVQRREDIRLREESKVRQGPQ